ncbi:ABC transporter substrate-binding protein [Acidipropionibacterium acidipropionici]|uniref:ABC transporter substrate-binding protein n=2 Tax=Acidipropionibacterium acidipropionici TaxID=1748 RepID=UPI00110AE861|nr:ABC transporter substrate-binding protein [Acidipropionibacterium acidipropionici]QCV94052.1 aliphatic sulfonate ABC transporter substrate-binding protein [Acidipropionibacterium acidipropionici]
MKKHLPRLIAASTALVLALSLTACGGRSSDSTAASNGPVKIARSSWIGFFPLDLAQKKGFFKKHGVDAQTTSIESKADSKSAMAAGRIQGIATTVDTNLMSSTQGVDISIPLVLDTSTGADGLVATKDIKSFKDLKGKKVALDTTGGASYFWFNYELKKNNMTLSDVNVQSMTSGDAGSAFVAKKVDAAMTWQPWLDKAKSTSFGHVVMDSAASPGVIVDSLGLSPDFIKNNPKKVQGIIAGWNDALAYMKSNPDDAYSVMSKVADEDPATLKKQMESEITFYDKAGNKKFFGTAEDKGPIYSLASSANTIWRDSKLTKKDADIDKLIDPTYVNK